MPRIVAILPIVLLAAASGAAIGSTVSSPAAPDLAAYAGKEPFEPVGKVSFFHHPRVVAAVAAVVPAALRQTLLAPTGPSGPVVVTSASVTADGCEAHNCGDHHWTVAVARSSGTATVCYHDAATMAQRSRWFLGPGRSELRDGPCFPPDH